MILALAACASAPRAATPEPVVPPSSPPPPPQREHEATRVKQESRDPIRLAILKLEGDPGNTLGPALCKRAHEDDRVKLDGCANRELIDEQLMASCGAPTVACLATIARGLGATQIVFGTVDAAGTVTLKLVDAETRIEKSWSGAVTGATVEQIAREGYDALVGKVR